MKLFSTLAAVAAAFVSTAGTAFANPLLTVPEPSSLALIGLGAAGIAYFKKRK